MMWFIIGLTTVVGPIGILIFYSYISAKDEPKPVDTPHSEHTAADHEGGGENDPLLAPSSQ